MDAARYFGKGCRALETPGVIEKILIRMRKKRTRCHEDVDSRGGKALDIFKKLKNRRKGLS